ncbi:type A chloramphenicol O-acetyltransferase [Pseudodesulfovibrio karagichevae]|uniref:Chloramphenicol acetyltransferase n=1 Tax=Pseudodesulfovibrio karagichevae TaxID=3239305 RepID=A0ABV4K073_9BACT
MKFNVIDLATWNRKEHFEHYLNNVRCSYSVVVNIDITAFRKQLKSLGLKDYIAQIYILTCAVNNFPEFRMSLDKAGRLGYWDMVNPLYTVLNSKSETFSSIWTCYDRSFATFHDRCTADISEFCTGALFPKPDCPKNIFTISSVPWIDFTAFNINVFSDTNYLLPIITIGKYIEEREETMMPLAIQVHHAVCDGFHVGKFIENVKSLIKNCRQWLPR